MLSVSYLQITDSYRCYIEYLITFNVFVLSLIKSFFVCLFLFVRRFYSSSHTPRPKSMTTQILESHNVPESQKKVEDPETRRQNRRTHVPCSSRTLT